MPPNGPTAWLSAMPQREIEGERIDEPALGATTMGAGWSLVCGLQRGDRRRRAAVRGCRRGSRPMKVPGLDAHHHVVLVQRGEHVDTWRWPKAS